MPITNEAQAIEDVKDYFKEQGQDKVVKENNTKRLVDIFDWIYDDKMFKEKSYTKGFMNAVLIADDAPFWQSNWGNEWDKNSTVKNVKKKKITDITANDVKNSALATADKDKDCGAILSFPCSWGNQVLDKILRCMLTTVGIQMKSGFPYKCIKKLKKEGIKKI